MERPFPPKVDLDSEVGLLGLEVVFGHGQNGLKFSIWACLRNFISFEWASSSCPIALGETQYAEATSKLNHESDAASARAISFRELDAAQKRGFLAAAFEAIEHVGQIPGKVFSALYYALCPSTPAATT